MNSEIAKNRIGEVIRIDTVTSTQADFLATHVPVNNIHIRKKWDSKSDKVMSEEQVFNKYVLNSENNHQFIIVIGSSGAGKSHLIRWFAARLEQSVPENEVVLFVRRSDNSLKGTIKQLLELPEVANIPNKAVYDRLVRATSTIDNKKLKDMIYQNFIVEMKNDENDEILSNNEKKRLVQLLQYEQFQLNPPIGIVLCADKSDAVVRYTLPEDETQVFASKYKLYLPSEEELLKELKKEYQAMESGAE